MKILWFMSVTEDDCGDFCSEVEEVNFGYDGFTRGVISGGFARDSMDCCRGPWEERLVQAGMIRG